MHPSTTPKLHLYILALLLCIGAAYSNIFHNAFLLDDEFLILKNRFLTNVDYLGTIFSNSSTAGSGGTDSFYRPMQGLIYLITYQLSGLSTVAFHIPNLLLHGLNACLIVMLGMRLRLSLPASFIAALLWALHPMHTEAVTYISATADPLYTSFCLLGLVYVLPECSAKKIFISAVLFICGLLSKETALIFPLLVIACIMRNDDARLDIKTYFKTWPLWIIAMLYIVLRMTVLKLDGLNFYKVENIYTENLYVRIFTFLATLPDYIGLILWPHDLHMDRAFPVYTTLWNGKVMLGALLFLSSAVYVLRTIIKHNPTVLTWGLAWFAAAHVLHTGIALPVNAFFLEHWMYMPSIGLFLAVAHYATIYISRIPSHDARLLLISAGIVLAAGLGFVTYQQNRVWATPIGFYENILQHSGGNARVHNNIAMAYEANNNLPAAIEHYKKGIAMNDIYPQTHHNLALALLKMNPNDHGVHDEAMQHLHRALEMNPRFVRSYELLARLYAFHGDMEKAKQNQQRFEELQKQIFGN